MNLVIPKTTLHRTNLQLNVDHPREQCSLKFESKRSPKVTLRRTGSADSSKRASRDGDSSKRASRDGDSSKRASRDGDSSKRAMTQGSNRTTELRMARANDEINGVITTNETGLIIPPQAKGFSPNVNRYKLNGHRFRCASRLSAMGCEIREDRQTDSPLRSSRTESYVDKSYDDKLLPSPIKPFSLQGRSPCQADDQLTIICRLRKEKERTERSMRLAVK